MSVKNDNREINEAYGLTHKPVPSPDPLQVYHGPIPPIPGALKYDGGKPCIYRGLMDYFPRALTEVAKVSTFGASKYAWKGWQAVPDGYNRYSDALHRHELDKAIVGLYDVESKFLHDSHIAWNALARLELFLRNDDSPKAQAERLFNHK